MFQQFHIGVKGVIVKNSKVLLLKRKSIYSKSTYFWDMAGGRIDQKGSLLKTLKREVREELGVNLKRIKKLFKVAVDKEYVEFVNQTYLLLIYFLIEPDNFKFKLSKEHKEARWVGKEDIKKLPKNVFLPTHTKEIILKASTFK